MAEKKEDTVRVNLLNQLSQIYIQTSQDSVWQYALAAKELAEKIHYTKGLADALLNISICHRIEGDYSMALKENLESIRLHETSVATSSLATATLQLAQLYKDMSGSNNTDEYLDRAIAYSKQSYDWYQAGGDTAGMVCSLNMMGICYRDKGKLYGRLNYYDTAYIQYTKALAFVDQTGKGTQYLSRLYNNISQVYSEHQKDFTKALEYLFRAVEINKQENSYSGLSFNYGNIAYAYTKIDNHEQSLLYARKMLEVARALDRPERIRNAYGQLHASFKGAGLPDSALQYYILADRLDDSLTNLAKTRQVMDLQTKYETGKKQLEIERLQVEGNTKNKRITILVIGMVLLAAFVGCMIWLYQRVKKQRQQIAEQSTRLEVMMKELHHRVKNNLQIVSSLLSLQTNKLTDEGAISVLKESQLRVQAMSFIHQRLYKTDTLTSVNMKEYLTDLAESLVASFGYDRDGFDLAIVVEKELMDIDKALPTGLIINEMVTNSLKYAYQSVNRPALTIALKEDNGHIIVSVKDNGRGIDMEAWKQTSGSFGKQLITALCKQLRAKQSLVVDGGTEFTITIPAQAA